MLSFRNEPGLVEAVRSLLEQEPVPEVVVVNSGGGNARATLAAAGLDVPVVESEERLLPGGARNAGIAATTAPYVAFLAGDCRAEPGWVAGRLRRHRAGVAAVASVLVNRYPASLSACASHLLLHHRLMRDTPPPARAFYGLSYDRGLFDRFGLFREDVVAGEDDDFNGRLRGHAEIVRADDVRTAHRYPVGVGMLLRDQYRRGRRALRAWNDLGLGPDSAVLARSFRSVRSAVRQARRTSAPRERARFFRALPLLPPAALAYAAGALVESARAAGLRSVRRSQKAAGPVRA